MNTVHLLDKMKNVVLNELSLPLLYQVVSIYKDRGKAGLVTSYGEHIGLYPLSDLLRVSNCNYDYFITLSEDVENDFFGYELEVNKMNSNKIVSTVMEHKENLLKEKLLSKNK